MAHDRSVEGRGSTVPSPCELRGAEREILCDSALSRWEERCGRDSRTEGIRFVVSSRQAQRGGVMAATARKSLTGEGAVSSILYRPYREGRGVAQPG